MRKIIGVILAGGHSSRMGADKAFVALSGRPLIEYVIERLAPQVDSVAISSNAPAQTFSQFGLPVFPDIIGGTIGPLAGIHAALRRWPDSELVTVAVDLPFLPRRWIKQARQDSAGKSCAFLSVAARHILAIWWKPGLEVQIESFINEGGRSMPQHKGMAKPSWSTNQGTAR